MEVVHIHWSGKPIIGGIEIHLSDLLPELNKNISSTLICGTDTEDFEFQRYHKGLSIGETLDVNGFLRDNLDLINKANIIHFHNGHVVSPEKTKILFEQFRGTGKNQVLSIHNFNSSPESEEILNLPFSEIIVYSDFMHNELKKKYKLDSKVLPCYIILPSTPAQTNNIRPVVLQPTRFLNWKGSDLSLRAVSELLDEGYDFDFVHGGYRRLLFGGVEISEKIKYWIDLERIKLDDFSKDEMVNVMSNSDLILHPTKGEDHHGEPFGLSCLEAMMMGKKIIASSSGNLPYLLEGYSLGTIIPTNDYPNLKFSLKNFLDSDKRNLSSADKKLISSWRDYISRGVRKYEELYSSIR
ncbi:glycosyltransferase family 4 protein [Candidatus Pacearchaeota archaeon]|nr:glycosyltransferase family 4 protein [Candidatus Pacearchaeota archaeon]